jgi:transposase
LARTKFWVGVDVGADMMSACVIDDQGDIVVEQTLPTSADGLHALLKPMKRRVNLIGLESSATATHLTRSLRYLKYEVAVFHSRKASKFLAIRQNKTDLNDARGLAEVARLGRKVVTEVHVKSVECQRLRSTLIMRRRLIRLRVAAEASLRSLISLNGGKLRRISSVTTLRRHVTEALDDLKSNRHIDLTEEIKPLIVLCEGMRTYVERLDRELTKTAVAHPVAQNFLEIPGVGPICALSFLTAIEEPTRFQRNSDVGAYLGMIPRIKQSGQTTKRLRITKAGCSMTRTHLVNAAISHLRFADSDLRAWCVALGARVGKPKARMALARKLAVVMLAMWKSGTRYAPVARCGAEYKCAMTDMDQVN